MRSDNQDISRKVSPKILEAVKCSIDGKKSTEDGNRSIESPRDMAAPKKDESTATELDVWFAECSARAKTFAAARELWSSVWNKTDRIDLGGDLEEAFKVHGGTVGMWEQCRSSGNPNLAILQINQILNSYPENRIKSMFEALGYSHDVSCSNKPNWEDITGKLYFTGKCV